MADEPETQDVNPAVQYWRWTPEDLPGGIYTTPLFGELVPGRVIEVAEGQVPVVKALPDWQKATKKQFDEQVPFDVARAVRRIPVEEADNS